MTATFTDADGSSWKWPDIEGLNTFKGELYHTANWKDDHEFQGKIVAVIGSGSSGIQIVPQLQPCSLPSLGSPISTSASRECTFFPIQLSFSFVMF